MNRSVVIIGGGIGGLFTGALLAKNGVKITVLEKNSIIGGGLQCFRRRGKIFETGIHVLGGFEEGGTLTKICRYLGIYDSLSIQHMPDSCMDEIRYRSTGEVFRIGSGKENFIKSLAIRFPAEEDNLRAYVDEIYRLSEEVPLFYLRPSDDTIQVHSDSFTMPADRLIARYIKDEKLREILAYFNPFYGGVANHTPAYVHALINVLYINGASRFIGGSQQLADLLCRVIEENGGEVSTGREVTRIEVQDRRILYVESADGSRYEADRYIAAIHPVALLKLLPPGTFLRGFTKRLNSIPNSYSAFSLYIDLKPGMVPYIDHTCYFMDDYGRMWQQDSYDSQNWPTGFMYMTPPDHNQGEFASRMLVHCVMSYNQVRRWDDTVTGRRGSEYEQWKQQHTRRIMDKLQLVIPNIREAAAHVYSSSPLTIRDFYHTKEGAMFGYRKDAQDLLYSQMTIHTKISNLLLTGQNINLHGICGVPLTAIQTAEAILGNNFLIDAIQRD